MSHSATLVVELLKDGEPLYLNFMDVDLDQARESGGAWVDAPGLDGYTAQASLRFEDKDE